MIYFLYYIFDFMQTWWLVQEFIFILFILFFLSYNFSTVWGTSMNVLNEKWRNK